MVSGILWCTMVGVSTLGGGVSVIVTDRILSIYLSYVDNVRSALRTRSPACRLAVVIEGGFIKIVMISVATGFKNLLILPEEMEL